MGKGAGSRNPVTVAGPWFPLSIQFLQSRACAELSPHAAKMLVDLCSALGPNASGNGDLSAAPSVLAPRGWSSTATRVAAISELERAGLLCVTKRGNRRSPTLYAITLWPIQCNLAKLDHGPGSYSTSDWMKATTGARDRPTAEKPAAWKAVRKNAISSPVAGQPEALKHPPRDSKRTPGDRLVPGTGTSRPH